MKIIFTLFLLLFICCGGQAQEEFDPQVKTSAIPSSQGYKQRFHDERYEGLYSKKVSSQVEIVSLTHGTIQYEMNENEALIISPPALKEHPIIGVTGKSFGLSKFYRFDMILKNKKKTVPVKEIIGRELIYPENLGIYGYTGEAANPSLYIPVEISSKMHNATGDIQLILLSNSNLDKVQWKYAIQENGSCSEFVKPEPADENPSVWLATKPITIKLSFPDTIKKGTILCVQVDMLTSENKNWQNKFFKIVMP